jgi:hypothetical protein
MRSLARVLPHALREFHQGEALLGSLDGVKGAQESCRIRLGKDFCQQVVGIRIAATLGVAKQYGDWYAEDGGHHFRISESAGRLRQPSRRAPIETFPG